MPRRSKVHGLSADVRAWLDRALADGNHAGYHALADELRERGYEISHAAVHRYDQKVQRRIAAIKASTEAARLVAASLPDGADDLSATVLRMVQSDMFDLLVQMQDAAAEQDAGERLKLLAQAARAAADATRAKVTHRRWQDEVRTRLDVAERAGGVTPETRQAIRAVLGIA